MTWRIGVLFSQTGVTAAIERSQLNGTLLAVDEINKAGGVLGRPIEPNIYDPPPIRSNFAALAERLLTADRVRLIFGCYMSSTRKAVLPVVEAFRGLLFYPTLYEGFEYSLHCIYTGAAPNQNSLQLAKYLLQHYGNRFLLIGSNYIYPYESNRVMADFITPVVGQGAGRALRSARCPGQGLQQGDQQDRSAQARRGVFDRRRPVDRRCSMKPIGGPVSTQTRCRSRALRPARPKSRKCRPRRPRVISRLRPSSRRWPPRRRGDSSAPTSSATAPMRR